MFYRRLSKECVDELRCVECAVDHSLQISLQKQLSVCACGCHIIVLNYLGVCEQRSHGGSLNIITTWNEIMLA